MPWLGYTHGISQSVPFTQELVRPDFRQGDLLIRMWRICLRLACLGAVVAMIGCGREGNAPGAAGEPESSEVPLAAGGVFIEVGDLDPGIAEQLVDPDLRSAEEFIASIMVPHVEFSRSNLADALIKIQEAAAEHSVSHQSFSVIVESGDAAVSSGNEAGSFGFESEEDDSRPAFLTEETFSGVYHNVPITTLLDEICNHFSVWYQITPYAVEIRHSSVPKPDYRIAIFPFDRAFLRAETPFNRDPFNPEQEPVEKGDPISAIEALQQLGFSGGANAYFDEANSRLVVKADLREIERIAKVLESLGAKTKE